MTQGRPRLLLSPTSPPPALPLRPSCRCTTLCKTLEVKHGQTPMALLPSVPGMMMLQGDRRRSLRDAFSAGSRTGLLGGTTSPAAAALASLLLPRGCCLRPCEAGPGHTCSADGVWNGNRPHYLDTSVAPLSPFP